MRFSYAHLLAGFGTLSVLAGQHEGRAVYDYVAEARSAGFFAWLLRFRVEDRTVATWDPGIGCSLGIEKHLREGRAVRDQVVRFDPLAGVATVQDRKIAQQTFDVGPCAVDVLSAFFLLRRRGVGENEPLVLPLFDNGKRYSLEIRFRGRETLDLPAPLGKRVPTIIVEPLLLEGTGLFAKEGRLKIWLTDDDRRIPVRMRTKVAIGSVSGDIESYQAPVSATPEPLAPSHGREGVTRSTQ